MGKKASLGLLPPLWWELLSAPGLQKLGAPFPCNSSSWGPPRTLKEVSPGAFGLGVLRRHWRCVSQVNNVSSLNLGQ